MSCYRTRELWSVASGGRTARQSTPPLVRTTDMGCRRSPSLRADQIYTTYVFKTNSDNLQCPHYAFSFRYVVTKEGEPAYEARIESTDLVFVDPEGNEVFRVEYRFPLSVEGFHFVDSETDEVVGRVVDDIALFGRRWTINDESDRKVATIRDKGAFRKLLYEVGLETTLSMPVVMEIVRPTGGSVGTVRRRVGITKTVEIEVEYGSGFDERLALGAALILDQEDAETRELRVLSWDD